ncbi:type I polyketide synthase, partial [Streptomyces acidiscabies]|uniref:type I polyketide synthase n=1 Tax=Streptomyces acidiscabies TaxID=42234 RepID=UPI0009529096
MASEEQLVEYLRRVTTELQDTRQQLTDHQERDREPIAIVGMACRFPGGVCSPEELWDLVAAGKDAIEDFPTDRGWDLDTLYHPDPAHYGTSYVRHGGFVDHATDFDAEFFGISPREALAMDPQQRLMLETSWELFERAGIDPHTLKGSRTGVYAGVSSEDYMSQLARIPEGFEGHATTGSLTSVISGRVAYTYGLEGPAITVDTACSASLVAVHLAGQALRRRECELAVAGGVLVLSSPLMFTEFSRQRGLAPDGRCKPFAAAADGTGFSEGVGLILLERLSDARRNGHNVLAVIRGSAVNQDGASNGLSAPNDAAQERVIRAALADARLTAEEVDAVEAHGTGTRLGDPIEAQALIAAYGGGGRERPLLVGSLKSNIGHTHATAGVAGVIKSVMALRHGVLPATLNVEELSPHVEWGAVEVVTEPRGWPGSGRVRRVGVSSFGISGTNAHLILEEAPGGEEGASVGEPEVVPWVVSARSSGALEEQVRRVGELEASAVEVGWSLVSTRSVFEHRAVIVGEDVVSGVAGDVGPGPVLVFPGQGSQWVGMGAQLLDESEVFAARIAECEEALAPHVGWSLTEVLRGGRELDRVDVVQPVLWAVMVSLAAVWEDHGVRPAAVIGHSQGEIAAACVAGALSLQDAARIVAVRSDALRQLQGRGDMASIGTGPDEVRALIGDERPGVSVAVVNSASSTVISGPPGEVAAVVSEAEARGLRARLIDVGYASHHAQIDELREELTRRLSDVHPVAVSDVAFYSTVTAARIDTATLDTEYWVTNLREQVRFAETIEALQADGYRLFIEASPHPVLVLPMEETIETGTVVPTLRRDHGGTEQLTLAAAQAFVAGADINWHHWFPTPPHPIDLPTYPFQHHHYWLKPPSAPPFTTTSADPIEAQVWQAIEDLDIEALTGSLEIEGRPETVGVLEPALPVLSAWRRRHRERTTLNSWRYRITWKRLPDTTAPHVTGTWLLLAPTTHPDHLAVRATAQALTAHGAEVRQHLIDTRSSEPPELDTSGLTGIVNLLALDEDPHPDHPAVPAGLAATTALIQVLAATETPLHTITQGAVGDTLTNPIQAQVWGFGRVAALEYPRLWAGLVDLPARVDHQTLPRLAAALLRQDEDQIALRPTGTYARRLVHAPADRGTAPSWRPEGTVLITGGTGGIGAVLARWLAHQGAPHLHLISRRGPDAPGAHQLTTELTDLGTHVTVTACDVSDRDQLRDLIDTHPPTAIIHAAGVPNYIGIAELSGAALDEVLRPKALAALHLHELTRELNLSAFVMFSSGAAVWGSGQQAAYGAANHFLDALAEHRHALGLPATSVAWGPWADAGMAADQATLTFFSRFGLQPLAAELCVKALHQAISSGEPTLTVADFDWARFTPTFTAQRPSPLLADLPENRRESAPAEQESGAAAGSSQELQRELASANPVQQRQLLLQHVREQAAATLGHADVDSVPASKPFQELGFDSLTAVELRNRLNKSTGLTLPTTVVFDHPTPDALAGVLRAELSGEAAAVDAARAAVAVADDEPIAIIGMACRYPGGVRSAEDLWELVADGRDAMGGFPDDRGWDLEKLYDPDPESRGTSYVREGGFLYDAGDFDAEFFGISPREAVAMDPQQRLLLETAWEAVERAGLDRGTLKGSDTGVFAGLTIFDYLALVGEQSTEVEGYIGTGNLGCVASGRVSYVLGLEGPAMTLDTGCSSSLVAIHQAAHALRQGECSLALAGGATVMATPGAFIEFSLQRGLARDGRCKPFAAAADGTGWAEGVGLVVLERLSEARRNGHRVLALIRGSAINQDGTSNGLTAPNGQAQQRVIRQALANSRLSGEDVDAVEAHGTGTMLGDPIEANALLATYGQDRPGDRPLWLGSVKSNIGHAQASAGVAGVIKTVMAMRNELLPRSLHIDEPTPHVRWDGSGVQLLSEAVPWTRGERPRRAGVSAFGISGTNAHVILEEAPPSEEATSAKEPELVPWVVSARSEAALGEQVRQLGELEASATEVGWSLVTTRSVFEHRSVIVGEDTVSGVAGDIGPGPVLVFPGQGSQWVGMGAQLLDESPVFAERIAECERALAPHVDWSLTEVLRSASELTRVDVVQPVLWAVMVSLAAVWEDHGVRPAAVVGHSQGEIAAACVAGALSLQDAARIVAVRSDALRQLQGRGDMASLGTSAAQATELIGDRPGVSIAAVNSASSTVISGTPAEVAAVIAEAEARGLRARLIDVGYASHHAQIDELREELTQRLSDVHPGTPSDIAFYSTVTASRIDTTTLDTDYWVTNLREQVRFAETIKILHQDGYRLFIEASPHPVLVLPMEESIDIGTIVPTLRRDHGTTHQLTLAAAQAFTAGADINWRRWFPAVPPPRVVDLPTYAFQHQRYWLDGPRGVAGDPAGFGLVPAGHPLLGAVVELADGDSRLLTGRLAARDQAWLAEHQVMDRVLLPGSAFVELALQAAVRSGCDEVSELTLHTPLVFGDEGAVDLQVVVGVAEEDGRRSVAVHARPVGEPAWTRHAAGVVARAGTDAVEPEFGGVWPPPGAVPVGGDDPYGELSSYGYEFGDASRGLVGVWRVGDDLFAEVALGEVQGAEAGRYQVHPVLFDSVLHAVVLDAVGSSAASGDVLLPFDWSGLRVFVPGAERLRVRVVRVAADRLALSAVDELGVPVLALESLTVRPVAARQIVGARAERDALFRSVWREAEISGGAVRAGVVAAGGSSVLAGVPVCGSLDGLRDDVPDVVVVECAASGAGASGAVVELLGVLKEWVDDPVFAASRLVVVTRGAVVARPGEGGGEPAGAALWGLVRSAQAENPGRLTLVDVDRDADSLAALPGVLACEEPELAVRAGRLLVPRFVRDDASGRLVAPVGSSWRLEWSGGQWGVVDAPECGREVAAGEVRVAVRAAGVAGAGVVTEVGAGVGGIAVGDRVMGGFGVVGPVAVVGAGTVAPVPEGWSWARAAGAVEVWDVRQAPAAPPSAVFVLPVPFDPEGTVLITGGTGALGALTARHLVSRYGARHLLLCSRRGADAPGALELGAELSALGARVSFAACDPGYREAAEALVASVPTEHPLTAVFHCAGTVSDAVVQNLTAEQVEEVMRVKAQAAWHLHELTRDMDLSAFVLYSSVAGLLGGPGQGSYSAANAFLDALAVHRYAGGAHAVSLAWGYWDLPDGMSGRLTDADRARHARAGVVGLGAEEGLALLDAAWASGLPLLAPVRLDLGRLRREAGSRLVPALLRDLVRPAKAGGGVSAGAAALRKALGTASEAERERMLLDLVCTQVAAVLGHDAATSVNASQGLRDLGFDSLTTVELRNRLSAATGLKLPATFVFDHPDPAALAARLGAELAPRPVDPLAGVLAEFERLEGSLLAVSSRDGGARL